MFHNPQTKDPQEQKRKALKAKRLASEGYEVKTIERSIKANYKTIKKWADAHGISLDPKLKTT
jgi:L-fucose isomerase-like protein